MANFVQIKEKRYNMDLVQYYYPHEYIHTDFNEKTFEETKSEPEYAITLCFNGSGISSLIRFSDETKQKDCLHFLDGVINKMFKG